MTNLVASNKNYRAHYTDRGTSKLIVTFDHFVWHKNNFTDPSDSVYGLKKWSHLHIGSRQNDWYTSIGLEDIQQKCLNITKRHSEVIHYGSSMAAYAALLFGSFFQANKIIAISPRFELDPTKPPFDTRALKYTQKLDLSKHRSIADVASNNLNTFIIFDPFMPEDSAHARQYQKSFPKWNYIPMPFGGHPAYHGLKHTGQIVPLVETLLAGDASPNNIRSVYRNHKRKSPNYWFNLGMRTNNIEVAREAHKFVDNHQYSQDGWGDTLKKKLKSTIVTTGTKMNSPTTITLANCDDYRIVLHDIGSPKTIITFGYWNLGISDKGFGTDFCLKNGYNNIYVSGKNNDWFQSLSGESLRDAVTPYIQDKDVTTYGLSLGGYAALYYGCFINSKVVAFSPRCGAHPILAGSTNNYKHKYLSTLEKPKTPPKVILDPFDDIDFKFFREVLLVSYEKIDCINIENAGHECLAAITASGRATKYVTALLDGKIPDIIIEDEYKANYLYRKATTLISDPNISKTYITKLLKLEKTPRAIKLAKEVSVRNDMPIPIPAFTEDDVRISLEPLDNRYHSPKMIVDIILDIAQQLEEAGAFELALAQYKLSLYKWPSNEKTHKKIAEIEKFLEINK